MGEFLHAFSVDGWKLGFQIINFLILLYLLNRFLFKPVFARLDERQTTIRQGAGECCRGGARPRAGPRGARGGRGRGAQGGRGDDRARHEDRRGLAPRDRRRGRAEAEKVSKRARRRSWRRRRRRSASCARTSPTSPSPPPASSCGRRWTAPRSAASSRTFCARPRPTQGEELTDGPTDDRCASLRGGSLRARPRDGSLEAWERDLAALAEALRNDELRRLIEHPAVAFGTRSASCDASSTAWPPRRSASSCS